MHLFTCDFGLEQLVNEMLTNLTRTREVEA